MEHVKMSYGHQLLREDGANIREKVKLHHNASSLKAPRLHNNWKLQRHAPTLSKYTRTDPHPFTHATSLLIFTSTSFL